MRSAVFLTSLASFFAAVQAQDALLALSEHMPKCSLACFAQQLPESACATELTSACLCNDHSLNTAVAACSQAACTTYELLQTKNVTSGACGVPIRQKGDSFVYVGIAGAAVAVVAFMLRMAASLGKMGRQVSWDDATMALVVVLAIPPAVFAPILVQNGLGRDIWTLNHQQITNVLKYYFLGEIFYVVALGISKISILFFYLRVFPSKGFRNLTFGVMGLSIAYTIAFFFATTFQCVPVSLAWTQWDGLHAGKCNDIHLQGWIAAAINIVLDAIVMILPLRHLAILNMKLEKKLMVMAMFSVGIFVIVVSAIRLYSLIHFANTQNITWNYVEAGMWSLIEIDVSIVCGCMPAHRLLIAKAWPRLKSTLHTGKETSTKTSMFAGRADTTGQSGDPLTRISIKPKGRDEGDFVPLVDIDSHSARTVSVKHEQ